MPASGWADREPMKDPRHRHARARSRAASPERGGGARASRSSPSAGRSSTWPSPARSSAPSPRRAPDLVVIAAAYTAVDQAEDEPELAFAVNADGAGRCSPRAARAARRAGHPSLDRLCLRRRAGPALCARTTPTAPLGVYGRSKLAGEQAVAAAEPRSCDPAHRLGLQPVRQQFRQDDAAARRRPRRAQRGRRPDAAIRPRRSISPTPSSPSRLPGRAIGAAADGIYHLAGSGETNWADFARAIFAESATAGRADRGGAGIPTSDYPTRARRPANSRLSIGEIHAKLRLSGKAVDGGASGSAAADHCRSIFR